MDYDVTLYYKTDENLTESLIDVKTIFEFFVEIWTIK